MSNQVSKASPTIEVSAGVLFRSGRLLLARRPRGAHLEGLWEFPGGKRQRAESFEDCLRREMAEELGIDVSVGPCLFQQTHSYSERTVHLRFLQCWLRSGEPKGLEGQQVAWVTQTQLTAHAFPEADEAFVEKLKDGLFQRLSEEARAEAVEFE